MEITYLLLLNCIMLHIYMRVCFCIFLKKSYYILILKLTIIFNHKYVFFILNIDIQKISLLFI